jgi:DNA recombination-dependent growth factor C
LALECDVARAKQSLQKRLTRAHLTHSLHLEITVQGYYSPISDSKAALHRSSTLALQL